MPSSIAGADERIGWRGKKGRRQFRATGGLPNPARGVLARRGGLPTTKWGDQAPAGDGWPLVKKAHEPLGDSGGGGVCRFLVSVVFAVDDG